MKPLRHCHSDEGGILEVKTPTLSLIHQSWINRFRRNLSIIKTETLLSLNHNYFIYIVTNTTKSVLYIGVTNDLTRRVQEHYENRGNPSTFAGKYYCYYLVYWERFQFIHHAIAREKELKKWRREKKEALISAFNPEWKWLNSELD